MADKAISNRKQGVGVGRVGGGVGGGLGVHTSCKDQTEHVAVPLLEKLLRIPIPFPYNNNNIIIIINFIYNVPVPVLKHELQAQYSFTYQTHNT